MLLRSVRNHLNAKGIFIFNTRFPSKYELMQSEEEEFWRSYTDGKGRQIDVSTIAKYNPITQVQEYTTFRRFKENGEKIIWKSDISLRYVYPMEMERLLKENGFKTLHLYQDWKKTDITPNAIEMVYVCQKK